MSSKLVVSFFLLLLLSILNLDTKAIAEAIEPSSLILPDKDAS